MLDLECFQDTCAGHVLRSHCSSNRSVTLRSVDGCDDPTYLDRGDISSSDRLFGYDAVSSIFINCRNAVLEDAMQVVDAFLIEVRQGCDVGDTFVGKTKHLSI